MNEIKKYENAAAELATKAKKYAAEHNVPYSVASDKVLEDDPELAERYKWE